MVARILLCQVIAPHFAAGIVFDVETGYAVKSAPIIKWMLGDTYRNIQVYCQRKRWTITEVYMTPQPAPSAEQE